MKVVFVRVRAVGRVSRARTRRASSANVIIIRQSTFINQSRAQAMRRDAPIQRLDACEREWIVFDVGVALDDELRRARREGVRDIDGNEAPLRHCVT